MFARFMISPTLASSTPEDLPVTNSSLVSLSLLRWDLANCRPVNRYVSSAGITCVPFIKELLTMLLNCCLILCLGAIRDGMSGLSTIPASALPVINNARKSAFFFGFIICCQPFTSSNKIDVRLLDYVDNIVDCLCLVRATMLAREADSNHFIIESCCG